MSNELRDSPPGKIRTEVTPELKNKVLTGPYLYNLFTSINKNKSKPNSKIFDEILIKVEISIFIIFLIICSISYLQYNMLEMEYSNEKKFKIDFSLLLYIYSFICYIFLIQSFYKVTTTKPGFCKNYEPNCSEEDKQKAIERETFGKEKHFKIVDIGYPCRYCTECQAFRCERSYHCKKCNCCVLKRDHHCPWIGQCVGQNNYRYFIQFLIYVPLISLIGAIIEVFYFSICNCRCYGCILSNYKKCV